MVVSARVGTWRDLTALQRAVPRADDPKVLVEHFPVSVGVVLGVVLAATGIFVFSMPMYRSPIDGTMLSSTAGHRYSAGDVRRAFAVRGLKLPTAIAANTGVTLAGGSRDLYVFVAKREVDSTTRDPAVFERRVGNVLVHYGGSDRGVLARVRAAVAALRG
jgi:hypothetical protein